MSRFDRPRLPRAAALLAAAALVVAAYAPAALADTRDAQTDSPSRGEAEQRSRSRTATPRRRPARLEIVDAMSFTITEQARISGEAHAEYDVALEMLEREQYDQGIARLLQVIEKAPDVTAPHINLGIAYQRIGNLEKAEESFTTALTLNPEHPVVLNELGLLYRETGRFSAARESYEKALAIHSGFHFAHRNLAILCDVYLDDLPCALTHYEAYSLAVPEDNEAAIWTADLRSRLGR